MPTTIEFPFLELEKENSPKLHPNAKTNSTYPKHDTFQLKLKTLLF